MSSVSMRGDVRITAPWGARLWLRARGGECSLWLHRRRDALHALRAFLACRRAASNNPPLHFLSVLAVPGVDWSVRVRGRRVIVRCATTNRWLLRWQGVLAALVAPDARRSRPHPDDG